MRLVSLETRGFRNLKDQRIDFDTRVSVLVGDNGHGKTSIIEAIFMLCSARSFRTQSAKDLVSWRSNEKRCFVSARFETEDGSKEISYEYHRGKRTILINGNAIEKASSFFGQFLAIVFTPDELQIVKGSPSSRRKFVDRVLSLSDSSYVEALVAYQRAIKNRNALLSEPNVKSELCKPWNHLLAHHGHIVASKRIRLIEDIGEDFTSLYSKIAGSIDAQDDASEEVELRYQSNFMSDEKLISSEQMEQLLDNSFLQDFRYGSTSKGIHRDEFPISIRFGDEKREARSSASQGQSRTATLSLKLAVARYLKRTRGVPPMVLLDDVESELDSKRVGALYEVLDGLKAQVIVTATEVSKMLPDDPLKVGVKMLQNGEVIS